MSALQPSLFTTGDPVPNFSFGDASRWTVEPDSWIDVETGWLRGSQELYDELTVSIAWEQRQRMMFDRLVDEPRLTAWFNVADDPTGGRISTLANTLGSRYATTFATAGLNWYRDHRDSVAWHGDRIGNRKWNSTIALVALGARRPFQVRPVDRTRAVTSKSWNIGEGDLLVMGGACQARLEHCVPKLARPVGPRMSIVFREHGVS